MRERFLGLNRSHTSDWFIQISLQSHWLAKRASCSCQTRSFSSRSMIEMKTCAYQVVETRADTPIMTSSFVTRAAIGGLINHVYYTYVSSQP